MNLHCTPRHMLATLTVLLAAIGLSAGSASAAPGSYGELERFGARQEQLATGLATSGDIAGKAKARERNGEELAGPEINYAIGVDPDEENAVFVLDEPDEPEELTHAGYDTVKRHVRIQKFNSATDAVEASREFSVTSPANEEESAGETEYERFSNIAIDAERGVLYVLSEEPRKYNNHKDLEAPVATTLFAFDTKELGFAAHTTEGVLAGAEALQSESSTTGAALIEPRGITVDATGARHEVIILAHEDSKGESIDEVTKPYDHFVLQRVSEEGKLGERYVDKKNYFKAANNSEEEYPSAPVVTSTKHVLTRFGPKGVAEVPYAFKAATEAGTEPTPVFTEPTNVKTIAEPEVENEAGGGLSLSPSGTLYEPASIVNEAEASKAGDNGFNWGILERSSVNGSTVGWSGGQSALLSAEDGTHDKCVLQPGPVETPMDVAAGANGDVFVLSPAFLEEGEHFITTDAVIELGPNGEGCPTATGSEIELSENGVALGAGEAVEAGTEVQLSTRVGQADALSVKWTIENQTTHEPPTVVEPNPLAFQKEQGGLGLLLAQQPALDYKFASAGVYLITARVHTDDLDSEQVEPKPLSVTVEGKSGVPAPPKVTRQPANATVTEPARAIFTAEASGSPKPKVQWQLSTDKGAVWTPLSGATSDTLTIEGTKVAETGNEYRAEFTNPEGQAFSNVATLSVNKEKEKESPPVQRSPESPPPPGGPPPPVTGVLPHIESKPLTIPSATIASTSLTVTRTGIVAIKVKCPTGETRCMGSVTVRTLTALSAAGKKGKRAILTLATGTFSVTGGAEQTIKLHLSSTARRLLAHSHSLRARATVAAHDLAGAHHTATQILLLRLAKHG